MGGLRHRKQKRGGTRARGREATPDAPSTVHRAVVRAATIAALAPLTRTVCPSPSPRTAFSCVVWAASTGRREAGGRGGGVRCAHPLSRNKTPPHCTPRPSPASFPTPHTLIPLTCQHLLRKQALLRLAPRRRRGQRGRDSHHVGRDAVDGRRAGAGRLAPRPRKARGTSSTHAVGGGGGAEGARGSGARERHLGFGLVVCCVASQSPARCVGACGGREECVESAAPRVSELARGRKREEKGKSEERDEGRVVRGGRPLFSTLAPSLRLCFLFPPSEKRGTKKAPCF